MESIGDTAGSYFDGCTVFGGESVIFEECTEEVDYSMARARHFFESRVDAWRDSIR